MKMIFSLLALMTLFCANLAFSQTQSMYDTSYVGPYNMYGQPTFIHPYQAAGQQQQQQQQPTDGLVFQGAAAVQSAAGYLWSYMPAPLRGVDSRSYFAPAESGPTIINFVPGTR
ncbi:MAG TPA: hypothetical protein VMC85_13305 [Desulfomonilaceae bacterium]|nr:hypothetical protein [Desulfomonilaceae bacterium]